MLRFVNICLVLALVALARTHALTADAPNGTLFAKPEDAMRALVTAD